ncbi:MAG: hypothetical protein HY318_12190 [Armatimonadetes bacterium]|nr:hypothetical protein [Armatimonadota bacterium]
MPGPQIPDAMKVDQLIEAIVHLPPARLHEFKRKFRKWEREDGSDTQDDTDLLETTRLRLPAAKEKRFKQLMDKSESGNLAPLEIDEYRAIATETEQLSVMRVEALAELTCRRGKPVREVMLEIGWQGGDGEA